MRRPPWPGLGSRADRQSQERRPGRWLPTPAHRRTTPAQDGQTARLAVRHPSRPFPSPALATRSRSARALRSSSARVPDRRRCMARHCSRIARRIPEALLMTNARRAGHSDRGSGSGSMVMTSPSPEHWVQSPWCAVAFGLILTPLPAVHAPLQPATEVLLTCIPGRGPGQLKIAGVPRWRVISGQPS